MAPPPERSSTFASLRIRNFRLYFTGQLVSQTGTWLTMVAQTLLLLELGARGLGLGMLAVAQFGPMLVLIAWAGALVDRLPKRRLLLFLQVVALGISASLALLTFAGLARVWVIYLAAALRGSVNAFDSPCRQAFVAEMVPSGRYANAMSLHSAAMTTARVFGPALAGLLVTTVGFGWTFALDACSFLAVISGLLLMRSAELHPSSTAPRTQGQVRAAVGYLRDRPQLWTTLVMLAITGVFAVNFQVSIPLVTTGPLHGDERTFTLLFTVLSIGSVAGTLFVARRAPVSIHTLHVSVAVFGASLTALAVVPNLIAAFPVAVVLGVASNIFVTGGMSLVQTSVAPELRGRVSGLLVLVLVGSTPIGSPLVGVAADALGARAGVLLGALGCLATLAYGRRVGRTPATAPAVELELATP